MLTASAGMALAETLVFDDCDTPKTVTIPAHMTRVVVFSNTSGFNGFIGGTFSNPGSIDGKAPSGNPEPFGRPSAHGSQFQITFTAGAADSIIKVSLSCYEAATGTTSNGATANGFIANQYRDYDPFADVENFFVRVQPAPRPRSNFPLTDAIFSALSNDDDDDDSDTIAAAIALKSRIEKLEDIKQKLNDVEKAKADIQDRLREPEKKAERLRNDIQSLKNKAAKLQKEIEDRVAKSDKLEDELRNLRSQGDSAKYADRINKLEKQNNEELAKLGEQGWQRQDVLGDISARNSQLNNLNNNEILLWKNDLDEIRRYESNPAQLDRDINELQARWRNFGRSYAPVAVTRISAPFDAVLNESSGSEARSDRALPFARTGPMVRTVGRGPWRAFVGGNFSASAAGDLNRNLSGSLAGGVAYRISPVFEIGGYGIYRDASSRSPASSSDINTQTLGAGLFSRLAIAPNVVLDLTGVYEHGWNDITISGADGNFDADAYSAGARLGAVLPLGNEFWLTPRTAVTYTHVKRGGYVDTAGTAVSGTNLDFGKATAEARLFKIFAGDGRMLAAFTPSATFGGRWNFARPDQGVISTRVTVPIPEASGTIDADVTLDFVNGATATIGGGVAALSDGVTSWTVEGDLALPLFQGALVPTGDGRAIAFDRGTAATVSGSYSTRSDGIDIWTFSAGLDLSVHLFSREHPGRLAVNIGSGSGSAVSAAAKLTQPLN
ncbi:MAG: autotransporter domain-containing protein [Hyphomicrobiales bacterium]|nr:autotransporter domain-containing protein [Hyphomicrobiales bacterium]